MVTNVDQDRLEDLLGTALIECLVVAAAWHIYVLYMYVFPAPRNRAMTLINHPPHHIYHHHPWPGIAAVFPEEDESSEEEDGGEGMEEEDEEEEGPEGEEGDEEAQQRRLRRRAKREKGKGGKAGKEALGRAARMEPALAREHFLMPEDERVRKEDVPERMAIAQLMQRGGEAAAAAAEGPPSLRRRAVDDMERHDEAVWVVDRLELPVGYKVDQVEAVAKVRKDVGEVGWSWFFWHHHLGIYDGGWLMMSLPLSSCWSPPTPTTTQVLELLQTERYEVPFLWSYRRDYFVQHIPSREVRGWVGGWGGTRVAWRIRLVDWVFENGTWVSHSSRAPPLSPCLSVHDASRHSTCGASSGWTRSGRSCTGARPSSSSAWSASPRATTATRVRGIAAPILRMCCV